MSETVSLRRWVVFVPGVLASVLPALLLAIGFDTEVFLKLWVELLAGPVKYWLPVLLGQPSEYAHHPMTGFSTWLYCMCLPLTFVHPIKPCVLSGWITGLAFGAWYGWATVILLSYLAPC